MPAAVRQCGRLLVAGRRVVLASRVQQPKPEGWRVLGLFFTGLNFGFKVIMKLSATQEAS